MLSLHILNFKQQKIEEPLTADLFIKPYMMDLTDCISKTLLLIVPYVYTSTLLATLVAPSIP